MLIPLPTKLQDTLLKNGTSIFNGTTFSILEYVVGQDFLKYPIFIGKTFSFLKSGWGYPHHLSSWCLVMVERLFLAVPRGCLQFVIEDEAKSECVDFLSQSISCV